MSAVVTVAGKTRLNLGPLTTDTWTYTCTEVIHGCSDCDSGWAAQTCEGGIVTDNQDCWPPRTAGVPPTSGALAAWGIYSPGLICPGGFTSAVAATQGGSSGFAFEWPLTAGETAIGCCPKGGFSPILDVNGHQTCVQFKPTTSFLVGTCGSDAPTYTPFSVPGTLSAIQFNSFSVSAPMFQMVYQASDLPRNSISSTSKAISSTSSFDSAATGPSHGVDGQVDHNRISAGAIAGIAIGAILGVIFLATFAFCLWRARRKRYAGLLSHHDSLNPRSEASNIEVWPVEADNTQVKKPVEMGVTPQWHYSDQAPPGVVEVNPNQPVELGSPYAVR
ncbi:hypothetical protein F5Y19DRAFT_152155 [Xylariaceae sp. FL1651]|nr:hypothetical protein F5Y19DRAFT_152155 [Xylariaceae sp. FL1651]